MKLGIISDLHVDLNEAPGEPLVEETLLELTTQEKLGALIIAGDISNDVHRSMQVLEMLQEQAGIPVLFVPGNHDYWSKDNGITDTWEIYRKFQSYAGCVSERPYTLENGWVVVGNSGWYDYTMGESGYSFEQFEQMHAMDRTWQDSIYVRWGMSNGDIHRYFCERMEKELAQYRDSQMIMVTHMLAHPYFKVPMPHPQWSYFNAFLGSVDYADLYRKYGVRYGIMGHVHYRKRHVEQGTDMICACLGYRKEWRNESVTDELRECLQIIQL